MSEKSEEKTEMSVGNIVMYRTPNWQDEITAIAGPYRQNETRESWLQRAASKSKSTFWHIKALYYGELSDPKYSVAFKVLSAADKARIEKAQRDVEKATAIYLAHAQRLESIDPDFHREQIDLLVGAARVLSARDSTGNNG